MRLRRLLPAFLVVALLPSFSGCARLTQWLEGAANEEEKKDKEDPAKTLADQKEALGGQDAGKRAAAVGKLLGLATAKPPTNPQAAAALDKLRPEALALAITLLDDADAKVSNAALGGFAGAVGFAEKTDDERQLDPEAYDRQVNLKRKVMADGLARLVKVAALPKADLRYGALTVLYQLGKSPVVSSAGGKRPEQQAAAALDALKKDAAPAIATVALDATMPRDVRLLAMECLAEYGAAAAAAQLAPLLADTDVAVRGRAALAMAEAGGGLGAAKAQVEPTLVQLAQSDASEDVKWRAALALGRLGSPKGAELKQALLPPPPANKKKDPDPSDAAGMAPLEAYRTYAQSHSGGASAEVATLNREVGKAASAAEEKLADERKRGYK